MTGSSSHVIDSYNTSDHCHTIPTMLLHLSHIWQKEF